MKFKQQDPDSPKPRVVNFEEFVEKEGNRGRYLDIPAISQLQDSLIARGWGEPQRLAILATSAQEMGKNGAASRGIGGNGYLGYSSQRMPISYLSNTPDGRAKQIHFLLEDLLVKHPNNWLGGGQGGPYLKNGADAYDKFWNSEDVKEATEIFNKSVIRPAGGVKEWESRGKVAEGMEKHSYQGGGSVQRDNLSKEQNKEIEDGITWLENWLRRRKNLLEENSIFTSTDNELESQIRNLRQTEYKDDQNLSSDGLYEPRTDEKESTITIRHWYPETITHEQTHALEPNPQVEAIKKLMENGDYLSPEVQEFWRLMKEEPGEISEDAIEQYGKYGQEYWDDPNEIYARSRAALRTYGKDPGYKYTEDDLEKMIDILFDNNLDQYDDKFLLHLFNDVASNDKVKTNPNFAKLGGLLKYQKGGTVASLWQQHTGISWKDVDKYVSGLKHTAADNEKLRARILSGEFDKLKTTNSTRQTTSRRSLIIVPQFKPEPNKTYYEVKAGDNLSAIAKKNNLTLQQLLKLNPQHRANPDKIKIGDQVVISSDEKADVKRRNIKQLREQEASYKTNLDVILASRHNSNFGVIDKDKQTLTVYDKDKNILATVPVNTGARNLDYNTRTYTSDDSRNGRLISHLGNESTPAGITEITSVSKYHGVPAFQRSRVGNDNKVSKVYDKRTKQMVDDNVSSSMHFEHGVGMGGNRSNGCVRLSERGAVTLGKYLGVGDRIYTLPQKEGSRFTLKDGNLSFTADNVYGKNKGVAGNTFTYAGKTYDKFDWDDYNVTNNRTYQPLFITANTSGNKEYDVNVNSFKSSLETNKENIQKQLGLSSAEYNSLAMLAMGIAQQESKFGTSKKYKTKQASIPIHAPISIKQLGPGRTAFVPLQSVVKLVTGDQSAKSEGIAQIKYGDDSDEIRNIYSNIGVTDDHTDAGNEAKSVIARLAHIYKNQYLGDKRLYDAAGMSMEEALAYLYNGGKRDLIASNVGNVRNATKLATTSWINRLIGKKTEVPLLDYSNKVLANSDKFGYYTEYKDGGVIKKKKEGLIYKFLDSTTSPEVDLKDFFKEEPSYPVQPIYIKQTVPVPVEIQTVEEQEPVEEIKTEEPENEATGKVYTSKEKEQFKLDMYNAYYKALKQRNLDDATADAFAKRIVAQDVLESNWGRSSLSRNYNFGGIKDFSGKGTQKETVEYINGKRQILKQPFRSFKNLDDYINYKVNLVGNNWDVFSYDPKEYYNRLIAGKKKYATDPNYATKLNNLYNQVWG